MKEKMLQRMLQKSKGLRDYYEQLYGYKLCNIQPTKKHTTYIDWISTENLKEKPRTWCFESENRSIVSNSLWPQTIQSMEFSRPEYWSG